MSARVSSDRTLDGVDLDTRIQHVLEDCGYRDNPYFGALRDGAFGKDDFVETQIQFYYAVVFFSRPMAAVAAKIPEPRQRVEVLRNVWEEHGEGDTSLAHGSTFLRFLDRLAGIDEAAAQRRPLWPEVRIFNTTLVGTAVLDDHLTSVAMMGIIERMFVDISRWIGRAVVDAGWIPRDRMVHYNVHETLDVKHAEDFFAVIRPAWDGGDAEDRYSVDQGLQVGARVFDGLYEGLFRARKRRATTAVTRFTR